MNLLEVKKATVKVEAIIDLISRASGLRLRSLLQRRNSEPREEGTPESKAYDKGWMDGMNAGIGCGAIEIQDLDAAEVIEALSLSEDEA